DCALVDGEGDCIISQDGDDDALWEMDEFLVLSENDVDICSDGCEIEIFISYRGNVVAGDSYVPVQ
ncbi:MAG: hypothetical protein QGI36_06415, partial [Candidatus Thalassarchaeaceae archaeon]|nr:hypothetical protein [Candidatus Thalassarchaeaceae archaeon]